VLEQRVVMARPGGKRIDVFPPHRPDRNDRILHGVVRDVRLLGVSRAGTLVAFLAAGAPALAQDTCTHDTLTVDGAPIAASFCVAGPAAASVTVNETFERGGKQFSRPLAISVVNGASVTRAVDDVPLTELGSDKSLHLTVAYRPGSAVLEHALLLPGAIVLK
jgi:hypothetical protein